MPDRTTPSSEPLRPCPYCGLSDHIGREHMQFVVSLSLGDDPAESEAPNA